MVRISKKLSHFADLAHFEHFTAKSLSGVNYPGEILFTHDFEDLNKVVLTGIINTYDIKGFKAIVQMLTVKL